METSEKDIHPSGRLEPRNGAWNRTYDRGATSKGEPPREPHDAWTDEPPPDHIPPWDLTDLPAWHYARHGIMEVQQIALHEMAFTLGCVTSKEVEAVGIPRLHLSTFAWAGLLSREAKGVYVWNGRPHTALGRAATICKVLPAGVICLLSAAYLHGLTGHEPLRTWVTLAPGTRPPRLETLKIEAVYMRPHLLEPHVTTVYGLSPNGRHAAGVRLTTPEKTVVDALRHAKRIGEETAHEILGNYLARLAAAGDRDDRDARAGRADHFTREDRDPLEALLAVAAQNRARQLIEVRLGLLR